MLKLEVILFETQDVITASVAEISCICGHDQYVPGAYEHHDGNNNPCPAINHTCKS